MAQIINGTDLMLFMKNENGTVKSLAFATSHSLSITGETAEISTKDHGKWSAKEMTKVNWQITSDNLYTVGTFNELFDRMMSKKSIEVYFCLKTPTEREGTPATVNLEGDIYDTWTPTTTEGEDGFYGRVYITSLNCTAQSGENATFSVTLDGIGALSRGLYGSVETSTGGSNDIIIGNDSDAVTYTKATGNYDSDTTYFIYSNGQMIEVSITSANFTDGKQIYYVVKSDSQA